MKKILIIAFTLIGSVNVKAQSIYILKLGLMERSNSGAKKSFTKVDTILAASDTAAFSDAMERFANYNSLMTAKYKASKDSSNVVTGITYDFKDSDGVNVFTKLPAKYSERIIRKYFFNQHK